MASSYPLITVKRNDTVVWGEFLIAIGLFLIWPLASVLFSLRFFKRVPGMIIFVAFWVFVMLNMRIRIGIDIYWYVRGLSLPVGTILGGERTGGFWNQYYMLSVMLAFKYHVDKFIIYVIWGIFWGFGLYLCLRILLKYQSNTAIFKMFVILSLFYVPPYMFSGLRFFTGCFYLVAVFHYIQTSKSKQSLWLLFIPPFFHQMILVITLVYLMYYLWNPGRKWMIIMIVVSFALSFVDYRPLIDGIDFFGGNEHYMGDERNNDIHNRMNLGWLIPIPLQLSLWFMVAVMFYNWKDLDEKAKTLLKLASFSIIFFNLTTASYDFHYRFKAIMFWMCTFPVVYYYKQTRTRLYNFFKFAFPICLIVGNWETFVTAGPNIFNVKDIFFNNVSGVIDDFKHMLYHQPKPR